jgi:hypothetical protein
MDKMNAIEQERFDALQFSASHDISRTQLKEIARRAEIQVGLCGDVEWKKRYQALADAAMAVEDGYAFIFRDGHDPLHGKAPII